MGKPVVGQRYAVLVERVNAVDKTPSDGDFTNVQITQDIDDDDTHSIVILGHYPDLQGVKIVEHRRNGHGHLRWKLIT